MARLTEVMAAGVLHPATQSLLEGFFSDDACGTWRPSPDLPAYSRRDLEDIMAALTSMPRQTVLQ
jgi:hypothetical protein